MKRCIINVAIGSPYVDYQKRLKKSIDEMAPDVDYILWSDELPIGSRPHNQSLYGFKMYAFQEAFEKYDSVIWLDSPTVLHKPINHVFEILEANSNGELIVSTEANLYQYINEKTLYYYGLTRQQVKDAKWLLNYGFVFGFTKESETYKKMFEAEKLGLFTTAHEDFVDHTNNTGKLFNGEYVEHRHEESIISIISQKEGRALIPLSYFNPDSNNKYFSFEKTPL